MPVALTTNTIAILAILALMSLASWSVILRKWVYFARFRKETARAFRGIERARDLQSVADAFESVSEPGFTRVLDRGLNFYENLPERRDEQGHAHKALRSVDVEGLRLVLDREIGGALSALGTGLSLLVIIAASAPLLGLLGTVTGIMTTFFSIAQSGSASIAAIAPGVSEALITTVGGLVVALPAAIAQHAFQQRMDEAEEDLEGFSNELVNQIIETARA